MNEAKQDQDLRSGITRRGALKMGAAATAALAGGFARTPKRSFGAKAPAVGKKGRPNVLLIITESINARWLSRRSCTSVLIRTPSPSELIITFSMVEPSVTRRPQKTSEKKCTPASVAPRMITREMAAWVEAALFSSVLGWS